MTARAVDYSGRRKLESARQPSVFQKEGSTQRHDA